VKTALTVLYEIGTEGVVVDGGFCARPMNAVNVRLSPGFAGCCALTARGRDAVGPGTGMISVKAENLDRRCMC